MLEKYFSHKIASLFMALHLLMVSEALFSAPANGTEINPMQNEIRHVVILMLENRSFDNVLGWLYENDAPLQFIPEDPSATYMGLSDDMLAEYTNVLKNSQGEVIYSCPIIKGIPSTKKTKLLNSPCFDPNEDFPHVTVQIMGSADSTTPNMSGFLQDFASQWDEKDWVEQSNDICAVMETYTAKQLPIFYAIAKHYAVSDLWFSSVPTQTNPNRAFSMCGTSDGEVVNGPMGKNYFQADTLWNRFEEEASDVSWGIYWQGDMIPGIYPGPYSGTNTFAAMGRIPDLDKHFESLEDFHELARNGELPAISFIEPLWTLTENVTPTIEDFNNRVLKNKSLFLGVQGNDMHPPGDVRTAENLIANVYTSLIANKKAWEKTLLIITFDEHGGLFDHVSPPAATPPDDFCQNGFNFDRFGVRVATLFISPKVDQGIVIRSDDPTTPFDHTSIISSLFKWKNIDKSRWNMGKRIDAAPTFENVITRDTPRVDHVLADTSTALPQVDPANVVKMGDSFYLKDKKGNYLTHTKHLVFRNKMPLEFVGGVGEITHGSFVLIKGNLPVLGNANLLETSLSKYSCDFVESKKQPNQWWTVKSADCPYVGAPVQYGDRIYLENHIYMDMMDYIPARLIQVKQLLDSFITTQPISHKDSDENYWYIVRE